MWWLTLTEAGDTAMWWWGGWGVVVGKLVTTPNPDEHEAVLSGAETVTVCHSLCIISGLESQLPPPVTGDAQGRL